MLNFKVSPATSFFFLAKYRNHKCSPGALLLLWDVFIEASHQSTHKLHYNQKRKGFDEEARMKEISFS